MNRHEITTIQWERLQPFFPLKSRKPAAQLSPTAASSTAYFWLLRTGAPWRDLPERYGPWGTVASRFYRWRKAGLWLVFWRPSNSRPMVLASSIGTPTMSMDIVRAHQHAAGAHTGSADAEALRRSQGGFSTKIHVRAEGHGELMTRVLTPGHRHEAPVFLP